MWKQPKNFSADPPERGIPLHENHHEHVQVAVTDFEKKLQDEAASQMVVDTTQGPNEKKALSYLDGFLKFPFLSVQEIDLIKAAKQAIKLGKFQKLQREVNALKKNVSKTPLNQVELVDAMLKILGKYPLDTDDNPDNRPTVTVRSFEKLKPEIIITESYSYPQQS